MKKLYVFSGCLLFILQLAFAQGSCIQVNPIACHFECLPVTYTGTASASATYTWTSTCGTFTNPTQQNPGNLCFPFIGTCQIQLVVQELGMPPEICNAEVIVFPNPDGLIDGDTVICSGDCAPIEITFSNGTPPFAYQIDDGVNTSFYTTSGMKDTILVCPIFSTTYTLLSITDGFGCMATGPFNEVNINVTPGIQGSVQQTGNMLCANPPNQNYQWWDCGFTQLQSISQCFNFSQNGCYCLIVSDANTSCLDTVCDTYTMPCTLTCGIESPDSVCFGDTLLLVYQGNASDTATFHWVLTPSFGTPITIDSVTTVAFPFDGIGCLQVELLVTDGNCQSLCHDTICTQSHLLFATLYDDIVSCDSCISIPIGLSGTPPYTVYVSLNGDLDTLSQIMDDQFNYPVCLLPDSIFQFSLLSVTDSLSQCPVVIGNDSITLRYYSTPVATITKTENLLCAPEGIEFYSWYDCTYSQLYSNSSCYEIQQSGCYCLVVSNGFCQDTVCGNFVYDPCHLNCSISLIPNACIGDSIIFAYTGNASSGALFNWLIDLPGFPGSAFTGNDTVILSYAQPGCYQVALTVFDQGCISMCEDSVCIDGPHSVAAICCDETKCDTCVDLNIGLTGVPPWTIYISDGQSVDTITGIMSSPYLYHVCPPSDSSMVYTLLGVRDTVNACPGYVTGINTSFVTLHADPNASIIQSGDSLCALPIGMAGYGWYSCAGGPYLDTSRCFIPSVSGCYCVDVSTAYDCVDTACTHIILTSTKPISESGITVFPNPFSDVIHVEFENTQDLPATWTLINIYGQVIKEGIWTEQSQSLPLNQNQDSGLFILKWVTSRHQFKTVRLIATNPGH